MPDVNRDRALWDEQDYNQYAKLPYYIDGMAAKRKKEWQISDKLLGKAKLPQGQLPILQRVMAEPTPIVRQIPVPNQVLSLPNKDIMSVKERTETETVYRHNFESPIIKWQQDYISWRKNQLEFAMGDIDDQIVNFTDCFNFGKMYAMSPFVYICGNNGDELMSAPIGAMNTAGTADGSKNLTWISDVATKMSTDITKSGLTLKNVYKALQYFTNELEAPAFDAGISATAPKDNGAWLDGKYILITGQADVSNWIADSFLAGLRNVNLDYIKSGFNGELFGNLTTRYWRRPFRYKLDKKTGAATMPAPQTVVAVDGYNKNETIPFSDYTSADLGVAILVGASGYDAIPVGPPPAAFSGKMSPDKYRQMNWNGRSRVTDNILINALNENNQVIQTTNKYGEGIQIIADAVFGIVPNQRRWVLPIIYRRSKLII